LETIYHIKITPIFFKKRGGHVNPFFKKQEGFYPLLDIYIGVCMYIYCKGYKEESRNKERNDKNKKITRLNSTIES
jgi:hypothetical protein